MRYKADDPKFKNYKVELDGKLIDNVVEADDNEGWVRTEVKKSMWMSSWTERKTHYGRVFIVRYEDYDEEE